MAADEAFANRFDLASSDTSLYARYTEIEANMFALILLVPDRLIRECQREDGSVHPMDLQESYWKESRLYLPDAAAVDRISAYEIAHGGTPKRMPTWTFICGSTPAQGRFGNWESELEEERQIFLGLIPERWFIE